MENSYLFNFLESTCDLIQSVLPNGHFTYVNPAWRKTLGYSEEELKNLTIFDAIHPDEQSHCRDLFEKFSKDGGSHAIQTAFRTKKGKRIDVEGTVNLQAEKDGSFITFGIFRDISERVRLESVLAEKMRFYHEILGTTSEGYWFIDTNLQTTDVNDSLCRLLGYTREEMIGKRPIDFVDEENARIFKEQTSKITTSLHRTYEIALRTKDGRNTHTIFNATTIKNSDGSPAGGVAFITDISERKEIEEELRNERAIFVDGPVVVFKWKNAEGWPVEYVSPNVKKVTGYSAEDFLSGRLSYDSIIYPDDESRVVEEVTNYSKNGVKYFVHEPYRIIGLSGETIWISDHSTIIRNEKNEITHYLGYIIDITQRVMLEELLRKEEERFELALKGADLGLWDWNIQTGWMHVNDRYLEILGYSPGEIEPKLDLFIKMTHPEDLRSVINSFKKHRKGKSPSYEAEYRMRTKSGEWKWILSRGRIFYRDSRGVPLRALGTLLDIDERKKSEEQLARAKREAEDATKLKDKFVSLVAHDLRSPFNSIMGFLNLLCEDEEKPLHPEHRQIMERVLNSSKNLLGMIDDLLSISRLKSGKVKLAQKFVNLEELVDMVMENHSFTAEKHGIVLKNEILPHSRIYADPFLIAEAFNNLLSNAIKFCGENGTIKIYIVSEKTNNKKITIAVEDSGIGIEKSLIADLFRHDIKTSSTGLRGERGTGLGLPYSRDILRIHDGDLFLEKTDKNGTIFHLEIPVVMPKILIVDDVIVNREVLKKYLKQMDAEFLEADGVDQALDLLKRDKPHLIITDIKMSPKDGFELLSVVRKNYNAEKLPVILMTVEKDIETREKSFRLGANDFISLPLQYEDIVPRIRRFIGG